MNRKKIKEAAVGYIFTLPSLTLLIVFIIAPIFISLALSFMSFNGFNTPTWVGIKNYARMFKDVEFLTSMKNTLIFVLVTVPIQTAIALVLAAILADQFRNPFGEFVRGTTFIPVLCSASIAGTIFFYLFSSEAEGAVNLLLSVFGIDKINWLGQRETALAVICIVNIWKNVGYFMVMLYAGIMDVPKSLYEAAKCDGANGIQQFCHITVPSIKAILYLVVTLSTIWAFQTFDITYVMTHGGPGNATISPVLIVYETAFSTRKMGYACAVACVLSLLIFVITIIQRRLFNEKAGGEDE